MLVRWRRRLQIDLAVAFLAVVSLAMGIVLWTSHATNGAALRATGLITINQIADRVDARMRINQRANRRLVEDLANQVVLAMAADGLADSAQFGEVDRATRAVVLAENRLTAAYLGLEDGTFIMAQRQPDLSIHRQRVAADGVVTWDRGQGVVVAPDTAYDPRQRPWYQLARQDRETVYTEPYVFASSGALGITIASPVIVAGELRGVVGADLLLSDIEKSLDELQYGEFGAALMVDRTGAVAAQSSRIPDAGAPRFKGPTEDLALDTVLATMGMAGGRQEIGSWLVAAIPVPVSGTVDWTLVLAVPESEFTGPLTSAFRLGMIVSIITLLLAAVVSVMVARALAKPIAGLAHTTHRIRDLELDDPPVSSAVIEIDELAQSMERMKHSLRAFRTYVPRRLVDRLVASADDIKPGGERRHLTVFFSDIAGFTGLAEGLDAETLLAHVNDYLETCTEPIVSSGGTIDKYIGDSVMAFWGAPEEVADHAQRACEAALQIQQALRARRSEWLAADLPDCPTRIGIATGPMVVGNLGSSQRLDYTVIGDTVNLASRLEGLNKAYAGAILISNATAEALDGRLPTREIDRVAVKGRQQSEPVHELLGAGDWSDLLSATAATLAAYRRQAWPEARQLAAALSAVEQRYDGVARLGDCLGERITELETMDLPANWSGDWIARHK